MEKDNFKFDLETQRFLVNRWNTEPGQLVHKEIIDSIKNCSEICGILDDYLIESPEISDPYAYPIYPKSEFGKNRFWVLTQDDLRGIHIYNEDLSSSRSLEKKSLSYSYFSGCNLSNTDIQRADLSYAYFKKCNMEGTIFAQSGGFNIIFKECNLKKACFFESGLRYCDFSGSNLKEVYFEGAFLENIKVDYRTKFDLDIANKTWRGFLMSNEKVPDILRAIRIAYETSELWSQMDSYIYEEKKAQRQYLLWPAFIEERNIQNFWHWFSNLMSEFISGHSTKPHRVIFIGFIITLIFSLIYLIMGTPSHNCINSDSILEALYFSLTSFATLGYGDLSYDATRPFMRILSALEAWIGAINISLFVVVLARKIFG